MNILNNSYYEVLTDNLYKARQDYFNKFGKNEIFNSVYPNKLYQNKQLNKKYPLINSKDN